MLGHFLSALELAAGIQQPGDQQLGHDIDQARAAQSTRRHVATDHLELDAIGQRDALDCAVGRPHPALDLAALERRTGRRRGAKDALGGTKHDLAIGADIDEDSDLLLSCEPGRDDAGDDVRPDVGADDGQGLDESRRMNLQPDFTGAQVERFAKGRCERHHRDRRRIDAEQQVQHRRVADDDHFVDAIAVDAGSFIEVGEDAVDGVEDRLPELGSRLFALHAVTDARDDVRAERRLAVEG